MMLQSIRLIPVQSRVTYTAKIVYVIVLLLMLVSTPVSETFDLNVATFQVSNSPSAIHTNIHGEQHCTDHIQLLNVCATSACMAAKQTYLQLRVSESQDFSCTVHSQLDHRLQHVTFSSEFDVRVMHSTIPVYLQYKRLLLSPHLLTT